MHRGNGFALTHAVVTTYHSQLNMNLLTIIHQTLNYPYMYTQLPNHFLLHMSQYKSYSIAINKFSLNFVGNEQFIAPETHQCACSNTVLTFECTTDGFGTTLWNGTAFNCENRGNQILLLNSVFASGGTGSSGTCSDNIVARGIKVDGRSHTSQLNVTVTSDSGLNQSTIVCHSSTQVGRAVLTILLSKEASLRVRTCHT